MRSFARRAGKLLAFLLLLLAAALLVGMVYESSARRAELRRHPPVGQMVAVGEHQLHLVCAGPETPGSPVVVLESGTGGWSLHWHSVQQQIAAFARVCAYDRAGLGWSEPGPTPRDGAQIIEELHTLLTNAGEPGPYLLVGASRGGQYVRLFAATYPDETVGLVLVDAEPEEMRNRSEFAQTAAAQNRSVFTLMGLAARLGIFRLLTGGDASNVPEMPCLPSALATLPVELRAPYLAVEGQPRCFASVAAEEAASLDREAQVRDAGDLGNLPLIVLTHGASTLPPNAATIAGAADYERIWQELQQDLAALSSQSELIVAEESGHNIMWDQPELVVEAVRRLIDRHAESP